MIEELISRVFKTRNQAHLEHWKTKSFSQHTALGDFYDDVIEELDTLVENYQGLFGLVKSVSISTHKTSEDILTVLKDDVKFITKNANEITNEVTSLQNLLDSLTSVYTKTIYKLTNLK